MASNNRNKLDEYHLKILRELLTHPSNKYCFDCHQRGPTYVNVTIGSFVCTRCSGILRGLTPPHRVKSITMATFTPEEIEIMKSRGNEYCKNLWLGLYDSSELPIKDEQQIKDFMIAKYEKKRYYADPVVSSTHCVLNFANGSRTPSSISSNSSSSHNSPSSQNLSDSSTKANNTLQSQSSKANSITSNSSSQLFTANFGSPMSSSSSSIDPFSSSGLDSSSSSDTSFANFDNNPAFGSSRNITARNNTTSTVGNGIYNYAGLGLSLGLPNLYRPTLKTLPLNFGRWSIATENNTSFGKTNNDIHVPAEDKYAALKDLDFQMKSQMIEKQQQEMKQKMCTSMDWGSNTNGNWPTIFSNPGVTSEPTTPFNPFAGEHAWNAPTNGTINPFGSNIKDMWNGNVSWQNGKNQMQNAVTAPNGWNKDVANPFKFQMGVWTQANGQHQSSNPFL